MQKPKSLNRRSFLQTTSRVGGATLALPAGLLRAIAGEPPRQATPVILATDIGDDIDDTWALGLLLRSPELDLKLVMTEYGKAQYRAKLLAKFLQTTGHSHVPVAVGPDVEPRGGGGQADWVKDYDLGSYPGKVHTDGLQAFIDTIMQSKSPVTVISIGPTPNVAAALAREPRIVQRARFVGMDGSLRIGYGGAKTPAAEWNVKADVKAAQRALAAAWGITITPLDTCGLVTLEGAQYHRVLECAHVIPSTIIQNYRLWSRANDKQNQEAEHHSSVLFDTVAVYLAVTQELCKMERLGVRVTDDGFTVIDEHAKSMSVATEWKNLDGYRNFLVNRLIGA